MKINPKVETIQDTRLKKQNIALYTKLMESKQTNTFLYKYQLKHQQPDISKAEGKLSIEFNKQIINLEKVYNLQIFIQLQ